ncbi:hypothetical protein Ccrd_008927 [Cynara cardunculus var. scolymus]|uniref:Uncharacterized protein n=1 Tax=Cynara cardunculus var. scolymus TaxID=59895 RepID=A0A103XE92_CYNCS|nr:hypothetical protein Ccrd_008927 [Cynara cardunculus var. scolymus]
MTEHVFQTESSWESSTAERQKSFDIGKEEQVQETSKAKKEVVRSQICSVYFPLQKKDPFSPLSKMMNMKPGRGTIDPLTPNRGLFLSTLGSHQPTIIRVATDLRRSEHRYARLLSCLRTGITRQLVRLEQHCMRTYYPYSRTRGETTSRSTYYSPRIKIFFLVVDTGKTQPDDVCWLVVRGLLVPAYPKGRQFPLTQSTEIPRNPWWISPTTQQQCGIFFSSVGSNL